MDSTQIFGDAADAPSANAFARLVSILALALIAVAGFWATTTIGDVTPTPSQPMMGIWGGISPAQLPRSQPVPVTLRLGFTSKAFASPATPELTRISLEISRNVRFQTAGLPSCPLARLYSSTASARQSCARSLVGHGSVISEVTLPGQAPATIDGHLLAFYAFAKGQPRILAQVTSGKPLPLTYVIPFQIENAHGAFGTSLVVSKMRNIRGKCARGHPNCFSNPYTLKGIYGQISNFKLSLHRLFAHAGKQESFVSADCPAPGPLRNASLPLVKVDLNYAGGATLSSQLVWRCRVSK